MKPSFPVFFSMCILYTLNACSSTRDQDAPPLEDLSNVWKVRLVGSTPCDPSVREMIGIPKEASGDFIRWKLDLTEKSKRTVPLYGSFRLQADYGIGKNGTPWFKPDSGSVIHSGRYGTVEGFNEDPSIRLIRFYRGDNRSYQVTLLRLNDNVYHLISNDQKLMVGNGGWSFTLNRSSTSTSTSTIEDTRLPAITHSVLFVDDSTISTSYVARTPSQPFAADYNLEIEPEWKKLKWLLKLYRDSVTFQPTTYSLARTDDRPTESTGRWQILRGIPGNPSIVVFQLDHDIPEKTTSLLYGDQNVLFLLTKQNQLYVGNDDFSFTFNRRE